MQSGWRNNLFNSCGLIFCLLLSCAAFSQPFWMQKAGGLNADEGMDISIDGSGNTYTTGYFTSTATFGTTSLPSAGVTDVFLTKTDPSGSYVWAVKGGGGGVDRALAIKTDAAGNSYITGYFFGTALFGSSSITSSGIQDIFIAKYDNTGALQWLQSAGGSDSDIGNGITIDNSGNVIITGEFSGSATFGSTTLTSMYGSEDVFIAKLDAAGNFLWAKKGTAHATDRGVDLACDPSGNIYVTGQFTDTITFDVPHFNNIYNAIFLLKLNGAGAEQWFQKIGGGITNTVSGIAIDAASNILITGNFTGTLTFFGPPVSTLTATYANRIFVAKFGSSGNFVWSQADASSGDLTSNNITTDASFNVYIIGNFKCILDEYSDSYGEGIFNSAGFRDIFVTKYTSSGSWAWSRQCAGNQDDNGEGLVVNSSGNVIITGSFGHKLSFHWSAGFAGWNEVPVYGSVTFCGNPNYSDFNYFISAGASDIIIANNLDPLQPPYDFFTRPDGGPCLKPIEDVCIVAEYDYNCPDTVTFCGLTIPHDLFAIPPTLPHVGPDYTYLWSTGSTIPYITLPGGDGTYWVTINSIDGCYTSSDTIVVIMHEVPLNPLVSDNVPVNTNTPLPVPVNYCGDSVLLTGIACTACDFWWSGIDGIDSSLITTVVTSGMYTFNVLDSFNCWNGTVMYISVDSLLPPLDPVMYCVEDTNFNDTIDICMGSPFNMYVYDSISNPTGMFQCIDYADLYWSIVPATGVTFFPATNCLTSMFSWNYFYPTISGNYSITCMIVRENGCDIDTVYITRDVYVNVNPTPVLSISGSPWLCPGDSNLLVVSGASEYAWFDSSGLPIWDSTNDSIMVSTPGMYDVLGTNIYGCMSTTSINIAIKPQPLVTMLPASGFMCPNDSVLLSCSGTGTFQWYGPTGPIGIGLSTVYGNTSGNYYCIQTDAGGCVLVSNTVVLTEYGTPYLLATPNSIICAGGSVTITVITNAGSLLNWLSPFSGSDTSQTVSTPGLYTCSVTSCGITTMASVNITASTLTASITASGPLTFCDGDSILLNANNGMVSYSWLPGGQNTQDIYVSSAGTYSVNVTDLDGCSAQSSPVTITITPNTAVAPVSSDVSVCAGEIAILSASGSGTLLWYASPSGTNILDSGNVFTTSPVNADMIYYVASQDSACKSILTPVNVTVNDCDGVIIPNVFTPNGDGNNDFFSFTMTAAANFHCSVYDRWGLLVYQWDDHTSGWDGLVQQTKQIAPDGIYYFILSYINYSKEEKKETGFIQLLRQ